MTVEHALPSGRHGLSRSFVQAHQRERLLRAVSRACAARGYLNVTVADIVAEAHVSRRTFYGHYASKEECFLTAFKAQLARIENRVASACTDVGSNWEDRVAAGLAELLQALAEQPDTAHTLFVAALAGGPRAITIRQRALRRYTRHVPLPRGAPPEVAESVLGAVIEIIHQTVLAGESHELPSMRRDLLYCLLVPLMGDEQASAALRRLGA